MYNYTCRFCNEELLFENHNQIGGHVTNCRKNPNYGKSFEKLKLVGAKISVDKKNIRENLYYENPRKCESCDEIIPYSSKNNVFCGHSCSATYNNKKRGKKENIKKLKSTSQNILEKLKNNNKIIDIIFYDKSNKIDVIWECPVCGKRLTLKPSSAVDRMYCGGSCRNYIINQTNNGCRSKAEKFLEETLTKVFPNLTILYNNREILENNKELDVFIPSLNFAVEWNGIYHYNNFRGDKFLEITQNKDKKKQEECDKNQIELYVIKDLTSSNNFIKSETTKLVNYIKIKMRDTDKMSVEFPTL